jgi:hypothetical protein
MKIFQIQLQIPIIFLKQKNNSFLKIWNRNIQKVTLHVGQVHHPFKRIYVLKNFLIEEKII